MELKDIINFEKPLKKFTNIKFSFDTSKKEIFLSLELNGENQPVDVTMNYDVVDDGVVKIVCIKSNREWINDVVGITKIENQRVSLLSLGLPANIVKLITSCIL